jgi:predicted outer membrane repeat protein
MHIFKHDLLCRGALVASVLLLPVAAQATERLVTGTGGVDNLPASQGGGPNPCTTLPCSLEHAIAQAGIGDTVRIKAGPIRAHDVIVNKTITITGPACANRLRIDAAGQGRLFDIATSWPATVTLNCLNLAGGAADQGGAVRVGAKGAVILSNSEIAGAKARQGGAIYADGGDVTTQQSELASNTADAEGGAIYSAGGKVTLRHTEVTGNAAGTDGGAVAASGGTVVIAHSDLINNKAGRDGGALHLSHAATLQVQNEAVLRNNDASGHNGGAIFGQAATIELDDNATLAGNTAARGGAVYTSIGSLTIKDSTLDQNQASVAGGAVWVAVTDTTIATSDLTGNTAGQDGGAIHREQGGALTLRELKLEGGSAARGGALADMPGAESQEPPSAGRCSSPIPPATRAAPSSDRPPPDSCGWSTRPSRAIRRRSTAARSSTTRVARSISSTAPSSAIAPILPTT